jgi:hypothetical protein
MPLKLNVGLSRKIGEENYGSRGASVNLELELDAGCIQIFCQYPVVQPANGGIWSSSLPRRSG